MYVNATDERCGVLLGVFSGADITGEHYGQSLVEMNRVDQAAAKRGVPFVYVVVVDKDVPRPPAVWRKRFSDANFGVKSERFYFAMVTTSMLMRGVFTAINWVTEKREGQHYVVVPSILEAQQWLAEQSDVTCPDLADMERRARARIRSSGGALSGAKP